MSRLSRADFFLKNNKKKLFEFYSDFTNNFLVSPAGRELARTTEEKSIKQSLKNIILTAPGERPFRPNFGSKLANLLFELNSEPDLSAAEFFVQSAIEMNEPRVVLEDVKIEMKPGSSYIGLYTPTSSDGYTGSTVSDNEVKVTITFTTVNSPDVITFTHILKRVR